MAGPMMAKNLNLKEVRLKSQTVNGKNALVKKCVDIFLIDILHYAICLLCLGTLSI